MCISYFIFFNIFFQLVLHSTFIKNLFSYDKIADNKNKSFNPRLNFETNLSSIANGGKYFDTGYMYHNGKSEEAIRKAVIERYPREKVLIADKMPIYIMTKDDNPTEIFNKQLERCGVNYFDYYLVHNTSEPFYEGACKELKVFDIIKQFKKEGKIRKIGISPSRYSGNARKNLGRTS